MGMTDAIDITPAQRQQIQALLERYLPSTTVWAFGSRVSFKARPDSDLDLVAFTTPEQKSKVGALKEAFVESDLPFRVDLLEWEDIPENFRKNINRGEVYIWQGKVSPSGGAKVSAYPLTKAEPNNPGLPERLIDIADIIMGQSPAGENVSEKPVGLPLLNGPTEFTELYPLPTQYTKVALKVCEIGDLLFCVRGSTTGRMNFANQQFAIGRGLAAIRGVKGFKTRYVKAVIENGLSTLLLSATGSTFPNVTREMIGNICIPRINAAEANKIAAILSALDDKIALNRATNQNLEQIAQALFKSWFVDFEPVHAKARKQQPLSMDIATAALFPDKFEESELGMIPRGWEVKRLGDVAAFTAGNAFPNDEQGETEGQFPFIKVSDMNLEDNQRFILTSNNSISDEVCKKLKAKIHNAGSIVLAKIGIALTYNRLRIITADTIIDNNLLSVSPILNSISDKILFMILSQLDFNNYSKGSALPYLNISDLASIPVLIPPVEILESFSIKIDSIFKKLHTNSVESKTLRNLRDVLLPELLTGRINVMDSEG